MKRKTTLYWSAIIALMAGCIGAGSGIGGIMLTGSQIWLVSIVGGMGFGALALISMQKSFGEIVTAECDDERKMIVNYYQDIESRRSHDQPIAVLPGDVAVLFRKHQDALKSLGQIVADALANEQELERQLHALAEYQVRLEAERDDLREKYDRSQQAKALLAGETHVPMPPAHGPDHFGLKPGKPRLAIYNQPVEADQVITTNDLRYQDDLEDAIRQLHGHSNAKPNGNGGDHQPSPTPAA